MRHKGIYMTGLVLLVAASAGAVVPIPDPLPTIDFIATPTNPTSDDVVDLHLSGTWPNSCVPNDTNVFVDGNNIEIRMLLPGAIDCNEPDCDNIPSAYELNVGVGPLAPGTYSVTARVVSCTQTADVESVGSFTVGFPAGGEPNEPEPNEPEEIVPGAFVVLLQDTRVGETNLVAGQAGVVVCCEEEGCGGRILVSWFLRAQGAGATDGNCVDDTPRLVSPTTLEWIDQNAVPLAVRFDMCGTLREGDPGCVLFERDNGWTYNLFDGWLERSIGPDQTFDFGDRVRVRGLLNRVRPGNIVFTCPEERGDIYSPFITPCAPAGGGGGGNGCCNAGYEPGDRVRLLVDNPPDLTGRPAPGLTAGTLGTVLCCDTSDENFTVYVSWDNFTGGFNMDFFCDTRPGSYPAGSGWWMNCDDIVALAGGGNGNGGNGNGGQPCPGDSLKIGFGSTGVQIRRDSLCTTDPRTFTSCATVAVSSNFRAALSLKITPVNGINGTWSGTITPNIVSAGQNNVQVCITAQNVNLSAIPADQDVKAATLAILAVPAP